MIWEYSWISGILFATAMVSILTGYAASRRRGMPGAQTLCLLMCAVAEWTLASGLEASVSPLTMKIVFAKAEYLGAVSVPVLFLVFVLDYSRRYRWLNKKFYLMLSIIPFIALALTITNEWHSLIWTGYTPSPEIPGAYIYHHGTGYYFLIFYDYLLILLGIGVLIRSCRTGKTGERNQVGIILAAALVPVITGLFYSAGINPVPGMDLTPISFSVAGVVVAFGIFRMQIFNIIPIARDHLIETMRDGVLVLDVNDRVVDINLAAQRTIGIQARDIIGKPSTYLPGNWGSAVTRPEDTLVTRREIRLEPALPIHLGLQITPLYNRRRELRGRLIVFRDVTEHRKAVDLLALRVEELGILNQISLAITSGLDLDEVLKTLKDQCCNAIPCDVFYVALYAEETGLVSIPLYFENGYKHPHTRDLHQNPGLTGFIIQNKQSLYIPDVLDPDASLPISPIRFGGTPARAFIGIPLLLRDKVIGIISIQSYKAGVYTTDQIRLLEMVAVEAAIAIENARMFGEIQRLAIVDELTGIYNYRGLVELGKREVDRARRFGRPLSTLFIDIDHFKRFNDRYSHATGNDILMAVAIRCRQVMRSVDLVARYGGDEFVVLLPETAIGTAKKTAHRLLKEINNTRFQTKDGDLSVSASIGVTNLTDEIPDIATLVDRANLAEHRAKEQGRNCVFSIAGPRVKG